MKEDQDPRSLASVELDRQISLLKGKLERLGGSYCDAVLCKALENSDVRTKVLDYTLGGKMLTGTFTLPQQSKEEPAITLVFEFRQLPPYPSLLPCFFLVRLAIDSGELIEISDSQLSQPADLGNGKEK